MSPARAALNRVFLPYCIEDAIIDDTRQSNDDVRFLFS